jgi:hypothetical protein
MPKLALNLLCLYEKVVAEDLEQRLARLPEHSKQMVSEEQVGVEMEKGCEDLASRYGRTEDKVLEKVCERLVEEHDDAMITMLLSGAKLSNGASQAGGFCRRLSGFCGKGEL